MDYQKTKGYRNAHQDIRRAMAAVQGQLSKPVAALVPTAVNAALSTLFAKIAVHLAVEDQALYPQALRSSDSNLVVITRRFESEMGGLKKRFEAFKQQWGSSLAIAENPAAFVQACQELLIALEDRMRREEQDLYDLIDRAS